MSPEELMIWNMKMIATLDERVRYTLELWMRECWMKGWYFKITYGRRSITQQLWIYASGRTRPGPIVTNTVYGSKHLTGMAIDVITVGGASYEQLESVGLLFGITRPLAHSSLQDKGHFEPNLALVRPRPDVEEHKTMVSAETRLKALQRRYINAADSSKKAILEAIEILKRVIMRRDKRS